MIRVFRYHSSFCTVNKFMTNNNDTICAIATAPYRAAIGVIRVSGENAIAVAEKIFSKPLCRVESSKAVHGYILHEAQPVDEVLVTVFRAPGSYTGQDTVEISCHGSMTVLRRVIALLIENGARQAEGGEFTKRAFLNGKLDLTQAEAVIDLIDSESENEARAAASQLSGHLSLKIDSLRQKLVEISAQILAFIDYPDDEIADVSPETLGGLITEVHDSLSVLKKSYGTGKMIKDGIRVVITGKPNVGKSCLMNRILGYDRSIVTDIAGTTRDIVEEKTEFAGLKIIVSDTAGIHETFDTVEKIGVQRAEQLISRADLILAVYDCSGPESAEDRRITDAVISSSAKKIAVFNKTDISSGKEPVYSGFDRTVRTSAATGQGMEELEKAVKEVFDAGDGLNTADTVTNLRQYECICRAYEALTHALENINMTPDAVLTDVEQAIDALGSMTGKTVSEQITENIFSRFCVGK